jgi:NADPH-dependent ferric siderophore reductase
LALESAAELRTTWLAAGAEPCRVLVAAVTTLDLPPGPGEVWVGCEAGAMRQIRAHLLHERGLEHRGLHTRAYWKREVANHSDHDTGAEDDDVPQLLRTDRS